LSAEFTTNGKYFQNSAIKSRAKELYNDNNPYSKPFYENSPVNRILEQMDPGADWHNSGKAIETTYKTNSDVSGVLSCALFTVDGTGLSTKVKKDGFSPDAQFYVTETKDEDGNPSYEFKNKLGQLILTRQVEGTTSLDTYYVYDDFGNLCFVLPPLASKVLIQYNGTWTDTTATMKDLAYLYKYDHRNRCIAKKLPGCEWIYYVYDKADRLIFSQDGEQYNKSPKEWTFSIPDAFGRVVLTGICKETIPVSNKVVKGVYASSGSYKRYNIQVDGINKTFTNTPVILSVNYYDNYDFRGMAEIPSSGTEYNSESGYGTWYGTDYTEANKYKNKGMLTGTLTAQMNPDGTIAPTYLYSVMYYDNRGRLIQTKGNSHLTGGLEKEYIAYNFTGQPTQRKHIHSAAGKNTQTEVYTYSYDHAGRLLTTTHQLTDGTTVKPQVTLAENTYDELGRLKTNRKGSQDSLNTTYAYNIRSWTKSISSPLFNQTLYYNESYGGSIAQYNGNISAMSWQVQNETYKRGYAFEYDNLSRITSASYLKDGVIQTYNVNNPANPVYQATYTYDKHGNMLTLQRYGKTTASAYGMIDNLTMNYTGNQLTKVTDAVANFALSESADFKNYGGSNATYTYNKNGAMATDSHKGITAIQYNSLNLPRQMEIANPSVSGRTRYLYSAAGVKLQVIHETDLNIQNAAVMATAPFSAQTTDIRITDYAGNMIYENGTLKRILVDGGYIESNIYHYYLTDHLGNNRVVANASGTVIQKNHYYPFGMAFAEGTTQEQGKQPYKYNGKELDQMHGLNMYDYSARYYEPAIGRFTTVDPMAEKYYSISPYAYCGNNPIRLVDVNGKEWGIVVNANGTMTVTLSVNFSVASNLNLTTAQVDAYKAAISAQLNSTFMEASGGLISASMSFDGGTDPNRFTPSIYLDASKGGMDAGLFTGGLLTLNVNAARDMTEFGETATHELFHTLNLGDVTNTPSISDTKVTKVGYEYFSTSTTAKDIHKNVMNYGQTKIDGKSYKELYNSYSGMNRITSGQFKFLINAIYKQMQGYGVIPKQKENEAREEYEKRAAEYYHNYWNSDY
ncbi:MAG: RHS repeat-associated core domain-containing protein, partial [Prevotella sp.]|nr:RHS repeat-associated core domain-containing protein [Prevotella sp.]